MEKKNVFITGVTGTMGSEGFKQLLERTDKFNIITIVRPSEKNKKLMAKYENNSSVKIVWGDITNYNDILKCVTGADYVLHVAAFISPTADYYPYIAREANVGSTEKIIKAIKAQNNPNSIKLVYIGSVAQTGDRMPPIHWGRTGDPLKPSVYDNYAVTKIAAERQVIESGLKYWVSLRQTGILHYGIVKVKDAILYHQPLNNCIEWVTAHDSGLLLANVCEEDIPEEFWCRIYNIGGGEKCRSTGFQLINKLYEVIGIRDSRKILEPNWFAIRNFHGQWYEDSHILNNYLNFQRESIQDFSNQLKKKMSFSMKLSSIVPYSIIKKKVMKPLAMTKNGPLYWMENNIKGRITAFFGSKEKWNSIPTWDEFEIISPSTNPMLKLTLFNTHFSEKCFEMLLIFINKIPPFKI